MAAAIHDLLTPDQFRAQYAELAQGIRDKVTADERRAAWLEQKRGKFGASTAGKWWTPARMTEANNKTTRAMIAKKAAELDGSSQPETGGPSTRWGNDQELPGNAEFMELAGIQLDHDGDEQVWYEWSECDQIGATPDNTWSLNVDLIPVEGKNPFDPSEHGRLIAMRDGIELRKVKFDYWCQVQQQIMVLNAPFGIFYSRDPRRQTAAARIGWWKIERDDEFIAMHGARLIRAVEERDALFAKQGGREWVDLTKL